LKAYEQKDLNNEATGAPYLHISSNGY